MRASGTKNTYASVSVLEKWPGSLKSRKRGAFQGLLIKVENLGVVSKTRLEDDHQTLTFVFGFMQLFDLMHSRGHAGSSITVL